MAQQPTVAGWLLAVLQTIIAAPLWAMMHMTPDRTFIGSQSQGYLLLLSLFVRPVLAVLGLYASMLVSDPMIDYIANGFFSVRAAVEKGIADVPVVGIFFQLATFTWWLLAFGLLLVPVLYMTFGLPQLLPGEVLKWIGAGISDLGETNAIRAIEQKMAQAPGVPSMAWRSGRGSGKDGGGAGGGSGSGKAPPPVSGKAGGGNVIGHTGQGVRPN